MAGEFCQRDWAGFCHLAIVCGALKDGCQVDSQETADRAREKAIRHYSNPAAPRDGSEE